METFYLPVTWEECGVVEIKANSLEEAIAYFNDNTDEIEIPDEKHYVDSSFRLTTDEIEDIRFMHEDEKKQRGLT